MGAVWSVKHIVKLGAGEREGEEGQIFTHLLNYLCCKEKKKIGGLS